MTFKYRFCLWKAFFEKGYGLTHYFFKLMAVVGIAANNWEATFYFGIGYAILALILGRLWFAYGLINQEHEVQNIVNPFVQEMRKVIGKPNNSKVFK